ncbi:ABC transporter ATP-binding protein [Vulgatibacter sp.]|uniref:ABC transporter ATP-binding protein n=1 Tax=Vulgatibacter sp. TaxID=1971226 RepID=UPI003566631C
MSEALLRLEGLRKSYGVGTAVEAEVIHGIDLEVHRGAFAAIIGPSGSGKSTLLNLLGLLDRPSAGRVLFEGRDPNGLPERERTRFRGRTIGFVFQFHHLLPAFTALENVMMPAWIERGRFDPASEERALALLDRVGLREKAGKPATDLSGGEQQRVAIARALLLNPPLLLADEPTGNLDTASADRIFELFREMNRERGTAVLVVTHDVRLATRCDRIVELVDGRVVDDRRQPAGG